AFDGGTRRGLGLRDVVHLARIGPEVPGDAIQAGFLAWREITEGLACDVDDLHGDLVGVPWKRVINLSPARGILGIETAIGATVRGLAAPADDGGGLIELRALRELRRL